MRKKTTKKTKGHTPKVALPVAVAANELGSPPPWPTFVRVVEIRD
jgi:hypothetical protein